jgi:hypothetical protein
LAWESEPPKAPRATSKGARASFTDELKIVFGMVGNDI